MLEFGLFQLIPDRRELRRDGVPMPLQPKLFDTLVYLVENRDRVVEKQELLDSVWPDVHVEEATLFQTVSALRKALGSGKSNGERYIATVPGRGYQFVGEVSLSPQETTRRSAHGLNGRATEDVRGVEGVDEADRYPGAAPRTRSRGRRIRAIGAVGVFTIVCALTWAHFRTQPAAEPVRIRRLTTGEGVEWQPDWAPGGGAFVYAGSSHGSVDIFIGVTEGGEPLRRTTHPADDLHPRWSPDGRHIAFLSDRGNGADLYLLSPYEGRERKIAETNLHRDVALLTGLGSRPWSPDSDTLLFPKRLADGRVATWKIQLSSGAVSQLTSPPPGGQDLDATWSRDGSRFAFRGSRDGKRGIWTADREGKVERRVAEFGSWPAWSVDGRSLYVSGAQGGPINIWKVDADSMRPTQVTLGSGQDMYPTVADDGALAYSSFSHTLQLYRVDLETGENAQLVGGTGRHVNPRVSPDGTRIAYQSNQRGGNDIWINDLAGGAPFQLTRHPQSDSHPDWSPDGERIVFRSAREGDLTFWVVEARGGEPRKLSDHAVPVSFSRTAAVETDSAPRWSPDGKYIGYIAPSAEGIVLWRSTLDGAAEPIPSTAGLINFGWYIDSDRVILTRLVEDGSREMVAMDLKSGLSRTLHRGPHYELDVLRDGSAVSFSHNLSHINQNLYVLALTPPDPKDGLPHPDGEPRQATDGGGMWHVHAAAWSPDGKSLVYTRDTDQADIYRLQVR